MLPKPRRSKILWFTTTLLLFSHFFPFLSLYLSVCLSFLISLFLYLTFPLYLSHQSLLMEPFRLIKKKFLRRHKPLYHHLLKKKSWQIISHFRANAGLERETSAAEQSLIITPESAAVCRSTSNVLFI